MGQCCYEGMFVSDCVVTHLEELDIDKDSRFAGLYMLLLCFRENNLII